MASTSSKNIMLSQSKIGQGDHIQVLNLPHTTIQGEKSIEVKVEVPGIDPATIVVGFENNSLSVHCDKGELSIPVDPTVDTSKIKADILWGMLTLVIPQPEPPASRSIKVSVHDAPPSPAKKPAVKSHTTAETEEE
jgi:HSP20 family molecular chaperone IbpA